MRAASAAKIGYRWHLGNGRKCKFWEDNWLGNSSLAIQYWEIYILINEKNATVASLWEYLKCTFRRCVDGRLFNLRLEVVQLTSTISFTDEEDSSIWQLNSRVSTSESLYEVVNFRGITPIYVPAVWSLKIPLTVHFFLWLLSKNKLLTRDNLSIRRKVKDPICLFCSETLTINHLFFDPVAKQLWCIISEVLAKQVGSDFVSLGTMLSNRRFIVENIFCSAAL